MEPDDQLVRRPPRQQFAGDLRRWHLHLDGGQWGAPWTIQSLNVNFSGVTLDVVSNLTAQTLDGNVGTIDVESGATLTLGSMNSSSGTISVSNNGTLVVQNLNNNNGTITAATPGSG